MEFSVADLTPGQAYKLLVASVVPRPIAFITSLSPEGTVNAAPYSFFNLMGYDPPVAAIGVGNRSPDEPKDTARNIRRTGECVINLVSEAMVAPMVQCATDFPPDVDELALVGLTTAPSTVVAAPRIAEAPISLECVEHSTVRIGQTRIMLARVVHFSIRDDLVDPERLYVQTERAELVGRMHGRGWYAKTTDLVDVPRMTWDEWREKHGEKDPP